MNKKLKKIIKWAIIIFLVWLIGGLVIGFTYGILRGLFFPSWPSLG